MFNFDILLYHNVESIAKADASKAAADNAAAIAKKITDTITASGRR